MSYFLALKVDRKLDCVLFAHGFKCVLEFW